MTNKPTKLRRCKSRHFDLIIYVFAKDCLLTGQEQDCTRITQLFVRLSRCQKWHKKKWLLTVPSDRLHMWYLSTDQTSPRKRNNCSSQSFALLTLGLFMLLYSYYVTVFRVACKLFQGCLRLWSVRQPQLKGTHNLRRKGCNQSEKLFFNFWDQWGKFCPNIYLI